MPDCGFLQAAGFMATRKLASAVQGACLAIQKILN